MVCGAPALSEHLTGECMSTDDPEPRVRACYATWAQSYFADYYGADAPYPPVHREIVREELRRSGARSVLDAGCGPASILRFLAEDGLDVFGFDLTPEMVDEARRVLAAHAVPAERLWQGSVLQADSFQAAGIDSRLDAVICLGVLPHIRTQDDAQVAKNLVAATAPGGLVMAEARNQFFGLFTQNRFTYDFLANELIRVGDLQTKDGGAAVPDALAKLRSHFRMDLPPVRKGTQGEPGYDEVLSRTHNPLLLKQQFEEAGLTDVRLLFYHYHCLPPMLAHYAPDFFRRESLSMENPEDWRGMFMASAFILTGRRR
ncbi:class I SAM-dependent methyltransferase (plasmid) [Azospirillum brasilense]|uniref:Class I SAM-dependent methyltransferase n=2 Tax=Azospirillum brasilense TaxID=192 RepID=A0A4D8RAS9_AZOBR|nr:class I SAM-dependent methyltransferase [Azospirillum brasilense]